MQTFEKLGLFYLGKTLDLKTRQPSSDFLLYDARDLVTHAVCVGMTGSGKTGLCIALLEEAAIDQIPGVIVDPKGDLGNLLLTFPDLRPGDFRPWINEEEARKRGISLDEYAAAEAARWRKGLAEWDQDGERIRKLAAAADFAIYTPGSTAGLPVSITSSFACPPQQYYSDLELLRDRTATTASGLLGLLGIQADPLRSREHILISNILEQAWMSRKDLTLASLIQSVQSPPLQRVGVFDIESFYPAADRLQLAMTINNLLAAPGFGAWLEGDPLDISHALYTKTGKPRMSIFSIAHLSDSERMFFVTVLLNQLLGWMRSQPGTTSLRGLMYMDEIFGFFPPVAEPPSKRPLLTLLKQARAYGLGIVLATQNPVDLDYKGLANTGTWFIGRLQTARDRDRLVDGLSGVAGASKGNTDPAQLAETISSLPPRVFLMQNVHEDHAVLFSSRWALSYLPGPLTRVQIKQITQDRAPSPAAKPTIPADPQAVPAPSLAGTRERPQLQPEILQLFAPVRVSQPCKGQLTYRPHFYAKATYQVVNNKLGIIFSRSVAHALELQDNMTRAPWDQAEEFGLGLEELLRQPAEQAEFIPIPQSILVAKNFRAAQKGYSDFLYREAQFTVWKSTTLKLASQPGESEAAFRIRLLQLARERRDHELERVRQRYASKMAEVRQRALRAEQQLAREREQYDQQKAQTVISVGATLLGALVGRKALSAGTLGRATTAARQASRILREKQDIARAGEKQASVQEKLTEIEQELEREADRISQSFDPQSETLLPIIIRPAKSDILIQAFGILWLPFCHQPSGERTSLL